MKTRLRSAATAILVAIGSMAAFVTATQTSQAQEQICEQFGTAIVQDTYVAQNNAWGTSEPQCITVTGSGFEVTQADGSADTSGAPKSYPSIYLGCHYTNCSPGTNLPKQISSISSANSSISYKFVDNAVYNASYDIWLHPTPETDGVMQTEIMIWLNRVGNIQPIGSQTGSAQVAGQTWEVWTGNNGSNDVISFVAPQAIPDFNFDVMEFVNQAVNAGLASPDWYLTSIQAGFEPWEGGVGLGVNSFSATVN